MLCLIRLLFFFVGLSYVLTLYFGGLFVQEGSLTVGQIVTFITYLNMLVWPLQAMGFLFNISQRASVSYDRIETLLAETPDIHDPSQPVTVIQNGDLEYDIEEFAYEKEPVLEKVAFHFRKRANPWNCGDQLDLERLPCCASYSESMTWSRELSC